MGGVPTDYRTHALTLDENGNDKIVPGLLAAGEVACASVHGANRLGANSLLDIVVFGRAAAKTVKSMLKPGTTHKPLPKNSGEESIARLNKYRYANGTEATADVRLEM